MTETDNAVAAAAADIPAPTLNPIEAAIDAALAKLKDPMLTHVGFLCAVLQRARALPVDQSRQAEALAVVEEFVRLGVSALQTDVQNTFARLPDLTRRFQLLSQPPPVPPEIEIIRPQARTAGWSGAEIDLLARMLKPGEKMLGIDVSEIRLAHRTLTRRAIRDGGRPAWYEGAVGWSQSNWEAQFRDGALIPGERP
jgi:hypothetical protein